MDIGQRKKNQLYIVTIMAVFVLAVSIWAFIQGAHMEYAIPKDAVLHGKQANTAQQAEQEKKENVTPEELGDTLIKQISFDTELSAMDAEVSETMVGTQSKDTEVILYMGEGTCADELLVLRAADEDSAKAELDSVQQHLGEMQTSFEDYLPKEAKKIEDAVIVQAGNYVIACVTKDSENAQKAIDQIVSEQ